MEAKGPARVVYVYGKVNELYVKILLDSAASCSVVCKDYVHNKIWSPMVS